MFIKECTHYKRSYKSYTKLFFVIITLRSLRCLYWALKWQARHLHVKLLLTKLITV